MSNSSNRSPRVLRKNAKPRSVEQKAWQVKSEALSLIASANASAPVERRVTNGAGLEVVWRTLNDTRGMSFGLRRAAALNQLSLFLAAAHGDLELAAKSRHRDLFSVSHPFSTRDAVYSLTASALRSCRGAWVAADPAFSDDVRPMVASLLSSEAGSAEHVYASAGLTASGFMSVLKPLIAAIGDGNSTWARSMRARRQRRDRKGRFAWMGGGMRVLTRRPDGSYSWATGRMVGVDGGAGTFDMELPNGRMVRFDGAKGESLKAVLDAPVGSDGFSAPFTPKSADMGDVVDESSLVDIEAPTGWNAFSEGEQTLDGGRTFKAFQSADGDYEVGRFTNTDGSREFFLNRVNADGTTERVASGNSWADMVDGVRNATPMAERKAIRARLNEEFGTPLDSEDLDNLMNPLDDGEPEAPGDPLFTPGKTRREDQPMRPEPSDEEPYRPEPRPEDESMRPATTPPSTPPPSVPGTAGGEVSPDGNWIWDDGFGATMVMRDGKLVYKNPRRRPHWYPANGQPGQWPSDFGYEDLPDTTDLVTPAAVTPETRQPFDFESAVREIPSDEDYREISSKLSRELARAGLSEAFVSRNPENPTNIDIKTNDGKKVSLKLDKMNGGWTVTTNRPSSIARSEDPSADEIAFASVNRTSRAIEYAVNHMADYKRSGETPVAPSDRVRSAEARATRTRFPRFKNVPEGMHKLDLRNHSFEPLTANDPEVIARNASIESISDALTSALYGDGTAEIDLGDGGELATVSAESLYKAMDEQGYDAKKFAQDVYDNASAVEDEPISPEDSEVEYEDIADAFDEVSEPAAADEDAEVGEEPSEGNLPPLLQGLTEEEIQQLVDSGFDHTPFLPTNEDIELPEGYHQLDTAPLGLDEITTVEEGDVLNKQGYPVGWTDDPYMLANDFSDSEDLARAWLDSLRPGAELQGFTALEFVDDNGDAFVAWVDSRAVRDALQLQGVDTNELLRGLASEGQNSDLTDDDIAAMFDGEGISEDDEIEGDAPEEVVPARRAVEEPEYVEAEGVEMTRAQASALAEIRKAGFVNAGNSYEITDYAEVNDEKRGFFWRNEDGSYVGISPTADGRFFVQKFNNRNRWVGGDDNESGVFENLTDAAAKVSEYVGGNVLPTRSQDVQEEPVTQENLIWEHPMLTEISPEEINSERARRYAELMRNDASVDDIESAMQPDGYLDRARIMQELYNAKQLREAGESNSADTLVTTLEPIDAEDTTAPVLPSGVLRETVSASGMQAGDVTADGFVVTNVSVDPETNKVIATGHYQGGRTQTREFANGSQVDVLRGIAADMLPESGDLPAINAPAAEQFGDSDSFVRAVANWRNRVRESFNNWRNRPRVATSEFNTDTDPHIVVVRGADLKAGDISVDPAKGHFVITEVRPHPTKRDRMTIVGYYPGHESQEKEWKKGTSFTMFRNVEAPAAGDLPAIHQPHTIGPRGGWRPNPDDVEGNRAYREGISAAAARFTAPEGLPTIKAASDGSNIPASGAAPTKPRRPRDPADPMAQGAFVDILREANGDPARLKELLKGRELVFFDFETTGVDFQNDNVWQIGAVKVVDGEVVDRFNMYMNPEKALDLDLVAKLNQVDPDGNPLRDEFLQAQASRADVMAQFAAWAGQNPLLVGQNTKFDRSFLERIIGEDSLDLAPAGYFDNQAVARALHGAMEPADRPKSAAGRDSNSLGDLARHYGIDITHHDAASDSEATHGVLFKMLDKMAETGLGVEALDVDRMLADATEAERRYREEELPNYQRELAAYEAAKAVERAMAGERVTVDQLVEAVNNPAPEVNADNAEDVAGSGVDINRVLSDIDSSVFPDGRMRLATREWAEDSANTRAVPARSMRVEDVKPGDFRYSSDGSRLYQIVGSRQIQAGDPDDTWVGDSGTVRSNVGKITFSMVDTESGERVNSTPLFPNNFLNDSWRTPINRDSLAVVDRDGEPAGDSSLENEVSPAGSGVFAEDSSLQVADDVSFNVRTLYENNSDGTMTGFIYITDPQTGDVLLEEEFTASGMQDLARQRSEIKRNFTRSFLEAQRQDNTVASEPASSDNAQVDNPVESVTEVDTTTVEGNDAILSAASDNNASEQVEDENAALDAEAGIIEAGTPILGEVIIQAVEVIPAQTVTTPSGKQYSVNAVTRPRVGSQAEIIEVLVVDPENPNVSLGSYPVSNMDEARLVHESVTRGLAEGTIELNTDPNFNRDIEDILPGDRSPMTRSRLLPNSPAERMRVIGDKPFRKWQQENNIYADGWNQGRLGDRVVHSFDGWNRRGEGVIVGWKNVSTGQGNYEGYAIVAFADGSYALWATRMLFLNGRREGVQQFGNYAPPTEVPERPDLDPNRVEQFALTNKWVVEKRARGTVIVPEPSRFVRTTRSMKDMLDARIERINRYREAMGLPTTDRVKYANYGEDMTFDPETGRFGGRGVNTRFGTPTEERQLWLRAFGRDEQVEREVREANERRAQAGLPPAPLWVVVNGRAVKTTPGEEIPTGRRRRTSPSAPAAPAATSTPTAPSTPAETTYYTDARAVDGTQLSVSYTTSSQDSNGYATLKFKVVDPETNEVLHEGETRFRPDEMLPGYAAQTAAEGWATSEGWVADYRNRPTQDTNAAPTGGSDSDNASAFPETFRAALSRPYQLPDGNFGTIDFEFADTNNPDGSKLSRFRLLDQDNNVLFTDIVRVAESEDYNRVIQNAVDTWVGDNLGGNTETPEPVVPNISDVSGSDFASDAGAEAFKNMLSEYVTSGDGASILRRLSRFNNTTTESGVDSRGRNFAAIVYPHSSGNIYRLIFTQDANDSSKITSRVIEEFPSSSGRAASTFYSRGEIQVQGNLSNSNFLRQSTELLKDAAFGNIGREVLRNDMNISGVSTMQDLSRVVSREFNSPDFEINSSDSSISLRDRGSDFAVSISESNGRFTVTVPEKESREFDNIREASRYGIGAFAQKLGLSDSIPPHNHSTQDGRDDIVSRFTAKLGSVLGFNPQTISSTNVMTMAPLSHERLKSKYSVMIKPVSSEKPTSGYIAVINSTRKSDNHQTTHLNEIYPTVEAAINAISTELPAIMRRKRELSQEQIDQIIAAERVLTDLPTSKPRKSIAQRIFDNAMSLITPAGSRSRSGIPDNLVKPSGFTEVAHPALDSNGNPITQLSLVESGWVDATKAAEVAHAARYRTSSARMVELSREYHAPDTTAERKVEITEEYNNAVKEIFGNGVVINGYSVSVGQTFGRYSEVPRIQIASNGESVITIGPSISVSGPNGSGTPSRTLKIDAITGKAISISNNSFALGKRKGGHGFSGIWNDYVENWLIANGSESVFVGAAGGGGYNGAYVWALGGFTIKSPKDLMARLDAMKASAVSKSDKNAIEDLAYLESKAIKAFGVDNRAQLDAILSPMHLNHDYAVPSDFPTAVELAWIGWTPELDNSKTAWFGQAYMSEHGWTGMKSLKPSVNSRVAKFARDAMKFDRVAVKNKKNQITVSDWMAEHFKNPENYAGDSEYMSEFANETFENFSAAGNKFSVHRMSVQARAALDKYVNNLLASGSYKLPEDSDFNIQKNKEAAESLALIANTLTKARNDRYDLGSISDRGESIRRMDTSVFEGVDSTEPVEFNVEGSDSKFTIQKLSRSANAWKIVDTMTGEVHFVRKNSSADDTRSELAANSIARALGISGTPVIKPFEGNDSFVISTETGMNLNLDKIDPNEGDIPSDNGYITRLVNMPNVDVKSINVGSLVGMFVLDALIDNKSRNASNILLAKNNSVGEGSANTWTAIPVDLRNSPILSGRSSGDYQPFSYFEELFADDSSSEMARSLIESMGVVAFKAMVDAQIKNALDNLGSGYMSQEILDAIKNRANIMSGYSADKWAELL